jgi:hypothetical protein
MAIAQKTVDVDAEVFLACGTQVEVVQAVSGGWIVRRLRFDSDGIGNPVGDPYFVEHVFNDPPTERLHEQVAQLTAEIAQLRTEKVAAKRALTDSENRHRERLEKLKQFDGLRLVEDFIEGKITHYAIWNERGGRMQILPFDEAKSDKSTWAEKPRLLMLYGDPSRKKFTWELSYYSSISAMSEYVCPCTSYEQAVALLQEFLDSQLKKFAASTDPRQRDQTNSDWIKAADQYGLKLPDGYRERHAAQELANQRQAVANAQKALDEQTAKLREVEIATAHPTITPQEQTNG